MATNATIKAAMRRNEREIMTRIRRAVRAGDVWRTSARMSSAWYNAMSRLVAAGRIRYCKRRMGWTTTK